MKDNIALLLIVTFVTFLILLFAHMSKYVPYTTITIPGKECSVKNRDPNLYGTLYAIIRVTTYNQDKDSNEITPVDKIDMDILVTSKDLMNIGFKRGMPITIKGSGWLE